ncbi:DEAD/DEAH box helicase [Nocardia sp. NPDC003979]
MRVLRPWQQAAYDEWNRKGRRGIVEAVAGTGKTVLGVRAAAEAVEAGSPVVAVVPDDAARERWLATMEETMPSCRIGSLAMPSRTWHVAVLTANTVARLRTADLDHHRALLIVDDLHRYGAGFWPTALTERFPHRLGFTDALPPGDRTVDSVLLPYFGSVIAGCDYPRARADGHLAPVTVVQVGVELTPKERARLNQAQSLVEREIDTLTGSYGAPDRSEEFHVFVEQLRQSRGSGAHHANRYVQALGDRATLLAECRAKMDLVRSLPIDALRDTQTVVFAGRAVAAGTVAQILSSAGVTAAISGPALRPEQRSALSAGLRDLSVRVLVEQRVPDETVLVPHAELGLFLARSHDRTEMIRRLGRVVTSAHAVRPRVIVIAYVVGSIEDPAAGVDGSFLSVAHRLADNTVRTDVAGLTQFLTEWAGQAAAGAAEDHAVGAAAPSGVHLVAHDDAYSEDADTHHPDDDDSVEDMAEAVPEYADLLDQLTKLEFVATGDEVGDLIGVTDPRELLDEVQAAADAGLLTYRSLGEPTEDLLLVSAAVGGTRATREQAAAAIAQWAAGSDDPVGELRSVMSRVGALTVPPHRLIQIAAFLRGRTPSGLL